MSANKHPKTQHEEEKLSGTLISVLLLGTFMVVTWFTVYSIFLSR